MASWSPRLLVSSISVLSIRPRSCSLMSLTLFITFTCAKSAFVPVLWLYMLECFVFARGCQISQAACVCTFEVQLLLGLLGKQQTHTRITLGPELIGELCSR